MARYVNELPQRSGIAAQLCCRASPIADCTPTGYNYLLTYFCWPLYRFSAILGSRE